MSDGVATRHIFWLSVHIAASSHYFVYQYYCKVLSADLWTKCIVNPEILKKVNGVVYAVT